MTFLAPMIAIATTTSAVPVGTPVSIPIADGTLRGTLYLPANRTATERVPAVIITGAWFTIKEQMSTTYAREFVRRGHAALVFDFRGFGESGGAPRNYESPTKKAEDIRAAANWLARHSSIDPKRLSGMAMCASSGYMANAINAGAPIRALSLSALWIQDAATVEAVYGGKESVANLIKIGEDAAARFAKDGTVLDVPAAGPTGSDAVMQQAPYYQDPQRGLIPKWDNKFALMSWRSWLTFDSFAPASRLRVPTQVLHSDNAALPDMARKFYAALPGQNAIWWTGEAHMEFYDDPTAVSRTVARAIRHADFHLKGTRTDVERVNETVLQMVNAVDAKAWGGVQEFFAPKLQVDYSSLGGPKGEVESAKLLKDWEVFHAKFHSMRHTYTNFDTRVDGDIATTRFEGSATLQHKAGEQNRSWTVIGDYVGTLKRTGNRWMITGMTFTLRHQHGTP